MSRATASRLCAPAPAPAPAPARALLICAAVAAVIAAAGCGQRQPSLPAACLQDVPAVERALERAPAQVRLPGGLTLSQCMSLAGSDADLQSYATVVTATADDLAGRTGARRRPAQARQAAVSLGYLIGAVRRGASHSAGVADELVRRLEQDGAAGKLAPGRAAELSLGLDAGRRYG